MNKLNKKLIKAKKKIVKIDEKLNTLEKQRKYLQDKIHLFFDSKKYDTKECEKYIIANFWSNAYKNYKDGGYITNDEYISKIRFKYEIIKIKGILKKHIKHYKRALDIGCGNGRYTKKFGKLFNEVIGIDLSQSQIEKNNKKNKKNNIRYLYENFITMNKNILGKFDFVFVGDIFMYVQDDEVESVFKNLLKLLNENGILIVRESVLEIGQNEFKSYKYVAYYRNVKFYKEGIFKINFINSYKNYGYNLYHLDKYFNVYKEEKDKVKKDPIMLEKIVEKFVDKHLRSSFFYLYKTTQKSI